MTPTNLTIKELERWHYANGEADKAALMRQVEEDTLDQGALQSDIDEAYMEGQEDGYAEGYADGIQDGRG